MNLNQTVWLDFDYMNKHYEGEAIPSLTFDASSPVTAFEIYFDNEYNGIVSKFKNEWTAEKYLDNGLVKIICNKLVSYFKD